MPRPQPCFDSPAKASFWGQEFRLGFQGMGLGLAVFQMFKFGDRSHVQRLPTLRRSPSSHADVFWSACDASGKKLTRGACFPDSAFAEFRRDDRINPFLVPRRQASTGAGGWIL